MNSKTRITVFNKLTHDKGDPQKNRTLNTRDVPLFKKESKEMPGIGPSRKEIAEKISVIIEREMASGTMLLYERKIIDEILPAFPDRKPERIIDVIRILTNPLVMKKRLSDRISTGNYHYILK